MLLGQAAYEYKANAEPQQPHHLHGVLHAHVRAQVDVHEHQEEAVEEDHTNNVHEDALPMDVLEEEVDLDDSTLLLKDEKVEPGVGEGVDDEVDVEEKATRPTTQTQQAILHCCHYHLLRQDLESNLKQDYDRRRQQHGRIDSDHHVEMMKEEEEEDHRRYDEA